MQTTPPLLFSIPLDVSRSNIALIVLHQGQAVSAYPDIVNIAGFLSDGQGGWISVARHQNGKWGYINAQCQWVVAAELDEARAFSEDGLARFCQLGKWGYLNLRGEVVIVPQYEEVSAFSHGLASAKLGKHRWAVINTSGELVSDKTFFHVSNFSACGLASAIDIKDRKLIGYIRRDTSWAIEPRFRVNLDFSDTGVAPATEDDRLYGLINTQGEWILKPVYSRINEFNADGLAYFSRKDSWDDGNGYLNDKGEVVVDGGRHLAKYMASGVVANDYDGSTYLRKNGQALETPPLRWGDHFNQFEYAVVRARAGWGILSADGSFASVPAHILEPLTNSNGWVLSPLVDTPLSPFLTDDGEIAYIAKDGKIAYRISYGKPGQAAVSLLDAGGEILWELHADKLQGPVYPPGLFFTQTIEGTLDALNSLDSIIPFAEEMLAETEELLQEYINISVVEDDDNEEDGDEDEDEDDDEYDDDEDDSEQRQEERRLTTRHRLLRVYINEHHNGVYDFMWEDQLARIAEAELQIEKALIEKFGPVDCDPEFANRDYRNSSITRAWAVPLKKPFDEQVSGNILLPEARQLWLGMYADSDSGDGDAWSNVYLVCAPSMDALEAARSIRAASYQEPDVDGVTSEDGDQAEAHNEDDDQDEVDDEDNQLAEPRTYQQWLDAVLESKYELEAVPSEILDDAMVDAAIDADVEALDYLPAQWCTPERMAAIVRKSASDAASIPVRCMTTEALALARSLYADDADWHWRDDRNSSKPSEWDKNSLYDVWGCLLDEEDCLKAVKAGVALNNVPDALWTERVERAALEADIYNISYIAKHKITPELARRAVHHSYGKLIESIPRELLMPALCMASVKCNGMSLEFVPEEMRTVEVCIAALQEDRRVFFAVPTALELEVLSKLIEIKTAELQKKNEDELAGEAVDAVPATEWHAYRAWSKLWAKDYQGAIEDARLALQVTPYPQHAHYVMADALRAQGRMEEAALEAATVLSLQNPYEAEFNENTDTSWLQDISKTQFDQMDAAALLQAIGSHPLTLADVPRARIDETLVATALAADPDAIAFVPKRWMNPSRYVMALEQNVKQLHHVPASMLSEAACISHVSTHGRLAEVPLPWRTATVCAHALMRASYVTDHVPDAVKDETQQLLAKLKLEAGVDEELEANEVSEPSKTSELMTNALLQTLAGPPEDETRLQRIKRKGLFFTWFAGVALSAKSDEAPTQRGLAGWLEQRAFLAMMLNGIFGLIALICHGFVSYAAWQANGIWYGIPTIVLLGYAEVYWLWRFLFDTPASFALAATATMVLVHYFGFRLIYLKAAKAIAAKHKDEEEGN
ncbi:WG repeat-containing protein [Undibacterium umbellatum]|uniref:WG repeat-containing protein n=1 Tax=Undibacterium umbellatum TaxID=2762300 RepID=A0ABR6ZCF8_9BURK|nr:WG repeat-containing protein [Undibacterium umbellatum]MBC3909314.1 WG repeat-containing protein [Undibacterium umbellatum]